MYKRRIKLWKLDNKRFKEGEMRAITRQLVQRQRAGKDSCFEIRNRTVTIEQIKKYWNRKAKLIEQIFDEDGYVTSPDVRCYTPPPSRGLSAITDLDAQENVLRAVRDFSLGSLENCIATTPGDWDSIGLDTGYESAHLFGQACDAAILLLMSNQYTAGGCALSKCFDLLGQLLRAQSPVAMSSILGAIFLFQNQKFTEVATRLTNYLTELVPIRLGTKHPIYTVCSYFATEAGNTNDLISVSLASVFDCTIANFPFDSAAVPTELITLQHCTMSRKSKFAENVQKLIYGLEQKLGANHPYTLQARYLKVFFYAVEAKYTKARAEALDIKRIIDDMCPSLKSSNEYQCLLRILARAEYECGDIRLAILYLEQALDVCTLDQQSPYAQVCLLPKIQRWLTEIGDLDGAFVVERRLEAVIQEASLEQQIKLEGH
jgi:hypothetical protein